MLATSRLGFLMPQPHDFARLTSITTPVWSRDGSTLYHLRGGGLPQVWAMDADGGNARKLSDHAEKVAFLRRAPKDDRLVWGIDAGGDERQQFWMMDPGHQPRPLTESHSVMHDFGAFSPDGTRIAYAANDRSEFVFDVLVMDLATGASTRLMRREEGSCSVTAWRPDAAVLAIVEDRSTSDQRLHLFDVATGTAHELPRRGPTRYSAVRWAGDTLMAITDAGGADFLRLCAINPMTGEASEVYAPPGRELEAWSVSPDSKLLATIENDRGYAVMKLGPRDGNRPVVAGLPEGGIVADLAWAPDSSGLATTAQSPVALPGIWFVDAGPARARPIAAPDSRVDTGVDPASFIRPELVGWHGKRGVPIAGWFARPAGVTPAAGWPSVVWVHGGPASQTRANFRADIQMLLAQGFAVMMPNIRGSTGYGRAFMEADDGAKRGDALDDLAAGRAWLAAQTGIDPQRIGIMGQSYGGWVVLAAIGLQPELWRSAVDYYGIADFVTLLDRTGPWRRSHRAREYGFPHEEAELFRGISPIHHVSKVRAPLLVLHGDRDPRVPQHESDQYVTAMRVAQKQVRYERFTYAGHGFIRPEHRDRVYDSVARHFQETL
jgi:dipeptidyl aminopeptidase/acylaminoacyl peptidase